MLEGLLCSFVFSVVFNFSHRIELIERIFFSFHLMNRMNLMAGAMIIWSIWFIW